MFLLRRKTVNFLALSMTLLALAGCAGKPAGQDKPGQPGTKPAKDQVICFNLGSEPESLDPAVVEGKPEGTLLNAVFDGLVRYGKDNKLQPALAYRWDISPDGKRYTFYLRNAQWTNGEPVTAGDFEYAWKRVLDPKTGSSYAYQLFCLKNGEAYNAGKLKDPSQVGVKALDDQTLEVTLEAPTPHFLGLTAFMTYYPVNKKVVEANPKKWYMDTASFVTNGPFKLVKWEHNQKLELVKNPTYWEAQQVKLDKLVMTTVDSNDTALTMFETGQADFVYDPPKTQLARLRQEDKLSISPDVNTYFYLLNVTKKPFNDVRVRKALALAIDRESLVQKVTRGGEKPARAFVPEGLPDVDSAKDFRNAGGPLMDTYNAGEARKLLADAGYPGGMGFPEVAILFNTNDNHQKLAQAIQEMWKQNLGINVKLSNQEWKVLLKSQQSLDYDISRASWSADYLDAMTFMDMFVTNGGNNYTGWGNKEYDALIAKAKVTANSRERIKAMHDAEKILISEMPVIPLYFSTYSYLQSPRLKDVVVSPFAYYAEFRWAWVSED
ncbi:MAG: peptide ABC transporter substrate-binding protein [Clostridia bacterium]|nr:peptide ABC transporter substrate-binding protein [Clostridia bacterium]